MSSVDTEFVHKYQSGSGQITQSDTEVTSGPSNAPPSIQPDTRETRRLERHVRRDFTVRSLAARLPRDGRILKPCGVLCGQWCEITDYARSTLEVRKLLYGNAYVLN